MPIAQRNADDMDDDTKPDGEVVEGEIVERQDAPTENAASNYKTIEAFRDIDDGDEDNIASDDEATAEPEQTTEEIERRTPENERQAFRSLTARSQRRRRGGPTSF